jgi:hypothetical protein
VKYRIIVIACILPILPILHTAPTAAFVENPCQRVLAEGFYNGYSRSNARLRDQAMYAKLCSSNFPQARHTINHVQQSNIDNSLGVSYGLFSPGGSGAKSGIYSSNDPLNEDRFNQWKSAYCSKNSLADSSRAAEFLMQKTVPQSVASTWAACMQKHEGLTCWATPHAFHDEEILLNVNWTKMGSSRPQVRHSFLTRGAVSKFEGGTSRKILPVGYKLNAETLQIPIARETDKSIVASLEVDDEGVEHSCHVFIPGERDFALITPFVGQ